ncbi:hypothetical protein HS088_TW20G00093 [Tripterygium wilfordii]|uniref:Uncharacterized protein n=1 Tax=Tripterygium wilfordii TaxID=458696 RepID=A0A7J7C6H2_TRIWF|nr:hypothetical protein HS088_TW20G00093 [Tripterygium wilfordii]
MRKFGAFSFSPLLLMTHESSHQWTFQSKTVPSTFRERENLSRGILCCLICVKKNIVRIDEWWAEKRKAKKVCWLPLLVNRGKESNHLKNESFWFLSIDLSKFFNPVSLSLSLSLSLSISHSL